MENKMKIYVTELQLPWWLRWSRIHLQCGRPRFDPWVGKIPWRRERLPTPVFWPGEIHGLYSPWGYRVGHDWATFTSLHFILLCEYTTIYLSIPLLMGVRVVSSLGQLWIVLLWTFFTLSFSAHTYTFGGICWNYWGICSTIVDTAKHFLGDCTN